jgi:chromosome segregation ATPase
MARGGIYRTDVEKARKTLLERGKNPSIDAIREVLGTGSKSTIHRHLKDIEADEALGGGSKVPISAALAGLVQQLADRLQEEAEARVAQAQERFEVERREYIEQEARRSREIIDLGARLQQCEARLDQERAAHAATQESLIDARATVLQLDERAKGLAVRVAEHEAHQQSLEDKHAQARDALEHFRTAAKEQRDQEQRRHEHQIQELQAALRQAGDALTGRNQEVLQLNRDNGRLAEAAAQRDKDLHRCQSELREAEHALKTLRTLEMDHRALKTHWTEEKQLTEQLRRELAAAQQDMHRQQQGREDAESNLARATARLEVFEAWAATLPAPNGTHGAADASATGRG